MKPRDVTYPGLVCMPRLQKTIIHFEDLAKIIARNKIYSYKKGVFFWQRNDCMNSAFVVY